MKRIQLLMAAMLMCFSFANAQTSSKHKYLKPVNSKDPVSVVIKGKAKDYYTIKTKQATQIKLTGPGKLRLLTRGQFLPGQAGKMKYEIIYTIDGGTPNILKANAVARSIDATYIIGTMGVPAQLVDFEILLGPGQHNIDFKLNKNNSPVAARFAFTPAKSRKKDWIAISPSNNQEVVELATKEILTSYYRFSPEKPLKVEINGPTELQVLTRAEFQYKMRGAIHYRIQVKMDNKVINTYQLSSKRSEIATYKNDKKLVPGKGNEFVINIPRGKHTIEMIPLDKDKNSILGRILIPKKDVKPRK